MINCAVSTRKTAVSVFSLRFFAGCPMKLCLGLDWERVTILCYYYQSLAYFAGCPMKLCLGLDWERGDNMLLIYNILFV